MTINTTDNRVSLAGNGVTTAISFPYYFLKDADLVVLEVDDTTNVETLQVIVTDYTVAGAGDSAGGTVTAVTAPATGKTWVVYRDPALTQDVDLVENDPLPVETAVEQPLDKGIMIQQRTRELTERSFRLPDGDTSGVDLKLPAPVALEFIRWNAAKTKLEGLLLTDLSTLAVSTFMKTVLDDTTGPVALTTIIDALVAETAPAVDDEIPLKDKSASTTDKITLANLLKVINALTAETAPATDDVLALYDTSASATDKITLSDLLKVINALTADASPDLAADYVVTYDASASGPKRVLLNKIGLPAATQAEIEAAASNTVSVTPGRANYHPGVAKGWIDLDGTGTIGIRSEQNVASVTDLGVGLYRVTWDVDFSADIYPVLVTADQLRGASTQATVAGSVDINTYDNSSGAQDADIVNVAAFGDQ